MVVPTIVRASQILLLHRPPKNFLNNNRAIITWLKELERQPVLRALTCASHESFQFNLWVPQVRSASLFTLGNMKQLLANV